MQWAAHWPAAGDINRWDTHVVPVVDLASDRGSIPRASTSGRFETIQRRPAMGAVVSSRLREARRGDPKPCIPDASFRSLASARQSTAVRSMR